MLKHCEELHKIKRNIKEYYKKGEKFRIYHGSTNSTRPTAAKCGNMIDTSRLNNIIRVDTESMIVVVEPNVPMDALLEETLKHDLMPLVVTEFPGITVGGAFSGTAGESSSFKHGYFDETVSKFQTVLANGDIQECSESDNSELFKGVPGSLGTLGVVTLLHIRLQKAYKAVDVRYHYCHDIQQGIEKLQFLTREEEQRIDFLDAIMYNSTKIVVIAGRMTDVNPHNQPVQRFTRPKDPWYPMHVKDRVESNVFKEIVALPDYLFRYNRGIFWLGKQTFDILGIKDNPTARRLTHHAMTARMGYARLHVQPVNTTLIQDFALPFDTAEEFIQWIHKNFNIYPLWLCPLRIPKTPTLHPHHWKLKGDKTPSHMLNVGFYDVSPRTYEEWVTQNRELEDRVHDFGGMKWSYAVQMYSEDRFWEQHDREWYDQLRYKNYATRLPSTYDKTKVDVEAGRKIMEEREKGLFGGKLSHLQGIARYAGGMVKSIVGGTWRQERRKAWANWPDPAPMDNVVNETAIE
jgi:hypothetical protein